MNRRWLAPLALALIAVVAGPAAAKRKASEHASHRLEKTEDKVEGGTHWRIKTAEGADLHLPLLPGSDVALYHGLLHLLLWEGLTDTNFIAAHTAGFEALRNRVREFTPRETARLTGLKEADLVTAARWFGQDTFEAASQAVGGAGASHAVDS